MNYKSSFIFTLVLFLCLGCASTPEPEPKPIPLPPTLVELNIIGDATVNLDANKKASPVLLRIYELKEKSNFSNADFFAVFDKEQATLAADLVHKQEILLRPEEKTTLKIEPDRDTKMIGFFAAFRDLDNAQWRALTTLNPHKTNLLQLKVSNNVLSIKEIQPEPEKTEVPK